MRERNMRSLICLFELNAVSFNFHEVSFKFYEVSVS